MESPAANRRVAFRGVNRRDFVRRVVAAGAAVTAGLDRPAASQSPPAPPGAPAPDDPTKVLGAPVRPYGERSRFEKSARAVAGTPTLYASFSRTPLQDSHGIITPSSLHFERHHGGVPDIDPRRHRLLIHGMVDRPLVLTMDEIRRLPTVSRIYFLECGGNTAGEWDHPRGKDVQTTHGLMSCSEWTGVPLSLLLREVGVQPGASWILAEGGDAAVLTRSLPMSKAMDDALVAYGQNGEALRPEQGYPLRLVVPGWEGIIWVKWLRRLKVVDRPYMTRNETATYTPLMPDGKAWLFPFVMDAKSVPRKPVPVSPTAGDGTADPGRVPLRAALPPQSYRGGGLGGGPKGRSPSDWMGPLRIG